MKACYGCEKLCTGRISNRACYRAWRKQFWQEHGDEIKMLYESFSPMQIAETLNQRYSLSLTWDFIRTLLRDNQIPLRGYSANTLRSCQEKKEKTNLKRYGDKNPLGGNSPIRS